MYNALKTPTSRPAGVSALYALKDSTWERLLAGKKRRFKCIVYKTNKNIMEVQIEVRLVAMIIEYFST